MNLTFLMFSNLQWLILKNGETSPAILNFNENAQFQIWPHPIWGHRQWRGNYFQARGGGRGAQLTFASVVHDREKPSVPQNLLFSSVLGHLLFTLWPFTDKTKRKYKNEQLLSLGWWFGSTVHTVQSWGQAAPTATSRFPHIWQITAYTSNEYEVTSG